MLKRRTRTSDEIPTSSMADIAFLLLVFFLVTTHFLEEKGLGLVLPEPNPPVEKIAKIRKSNMMYFIVYGRDQIMMKHQDEERTMAIPEIRNFVRASLQANDQLIVSIKPDPNAPYGAMIDVLDELRAADARRITLGQLKPDEG